MLNGTHTYTYRTVQLSLTPELPLQRKDAALFIAGIMEWGSQYGFTTVGEVMFFNPQGTRLAVAKLDKSSAQTATAQTPGPTSLSTSPILWPLPTVPGFFIRFNTYGHPLRREDSLRALEAADATLIYLYHQAPEGVNPILPGVRTWTVGTVSFTITPASQLNVIDATRFALGMMQWGCANGFTETDVEFVRRIGGSRGEMVGFGTGKLSAAGRDVA